MLWFNWRMSIKPEHRFRNRVRKALSKDIYCWPVSDSYQRGVPDHWYSGAGGDLWAEYKWYPNDKPVFDLTKSEKNPKLSVLQQSWLNRRHTEGRNVCVIVGFPSYCVVLRDGQWMDPVTVSSPLNVKELARWIESQTLPSTSRPTSTSTTR